MYIENRKEITAIYAHLDFIYIYINLYFSVAVVSFRSACAVAVYLVFDFQLARTFFIFARRRIAFFRYGAVTRETVVLVQ